MNKLEQKSKQPSNKIWLWVILVGIALFGLTIYKFEIVPPLWWDEGWTLQVARNWVERGFYGQIMDGEQQSAGLAAHFPVVASAALSFKLFGVGIWQGRLPGLIYFFLALVLLFYLIRNLFNTRIAVCMFFILLLTFQGANHIVLRGREILGENIAIFWLIVGYVLLWKTMGRSIWFLIPTIIAWAMAINTKAQVFPFFAASILTALGFALIKRWWHASLIIFSAGLGAWLASKGLLYIQGLILQGIKIPSQGPLENYYAFTALVLDWAVRQKALIILFTYGLLTFLGISYAVWKQFQRIKQDNLVIPDETIRVALLGLAASWMAWYVFFSNTWARYFYPPSVFGSIFAAIFLYEITNGFSWSATKAEFKKNLLSWKTILLPWVILLMLAYAIFSTKELMDRFAYYGKDHYLDAAAYVQKSISPTALIESYETEMFFLLPEHRFHYPSDQIHVNAELNTLSGNSDLFEYDPLVADPDYLILGPYNNIHSVYDETVINGAFNLIAKFNDYQIYERVR